MQMEFERRVARLALPACPTCRNVAISVTLRTDWVIYLRCQACSDVWNAPKPNADPAAFWFVIDEAARHGLEPFA